MDDTARLGRPSRDLTDNLYLFEIASPSLAMTHKIQS
jgi:hypothetical protein